MPKSKAEPQPFGQQFPIEFSDGETTIGFFDWAGVAQEVDRADACTVSVDSDICYIVTIDGVVWARTRPARWELEARITFKTLGGV